MKIRNLDLKSRVFLAPMLEPNDVSFRLLCKRAGCGLTWTGMTSPLSRAKIDLDDRPILQLFGNSSRGIKSFMRKYDPAVSGWDFNLGCPSKLSRKLGHGACLGDLDVIEKILTTMRESTEKFLSVKIRKSGIGLEIARLAEACGVDAVTIHARTLGQGYSGEVDYDFALELKKALGIPVIFSGVSRLEDVERILRDFDFVMIGRAGIGKPHIFEEVDGESGKIKVKEKTIDCTDLHRFEEYLELAERFGIYFRQVKYQAMNWTKGLRGGAELRRRLVDARDEREIREVFGLYRM